MTDSASGVCSIEHIRRGFLASRFVRRRAAVAENENQNGYVCAYELRGTGAYLGPFLNLTHFGMSDDKGHRRVGDRRCHSPRAERMTVTPPSPPSAQSVQTKKKPPADLAMSP